MSRRHIFMTAAVMAALASAVLGVYASASNGEDANTDSIVKRYTDCVVAAGLNDVGGTQPVWDDAGRLVWMKTGIDVPAEVHSPCFLAVGGTGTSLGTSSWGN